MPNVLKSIFRSNHKQAAAAGDASVTSKKKSVVPRKGPATIFRRKDHSIRSQNKQHPKLEIIPQQQLPRLEQNLTWTLSQDDEEDDEEDNMTTTSNRMSIESFKEESTTIHVQEETITTTITEKAKDEETTFTFTESEMVQHQLNHIRALSQLETKVADLKYDMEALKSQHETEMAKKDDDYVELLIKVRSTEHELSQVKGELGDVKEELGVVAATLMQWQHKHYQQQLRKEQHEGFWSSFSYFG